MDGWMDLFNTQGAAGVAGALEPPLGHGGVLAQGELCTVIILLM